MDYNDITALLAKKRYHKDIDSSRKKQNEYREKKRNELPKCDECENCVLVEKEKLDGHRRLCKSKMRLIEQKITTCPQWCEKRTPSKDYLKRRENILKMKREQYAKNKVV